MKYYACEIAYLRHNGTTQLNLCVRVIYNNSPQTDLKYRAFIYVDLLTSCRSVPHRKFFHWNRPDIRAHQRQKHGREKA